MTTPEFTRISQTQGTVTFSPGVTEVNITLSVFKRSYYEDLDDLTTFLFYLYNPSLGAEIGNQSSILIYYYDDPTYMNDAIYSYPTLNTFINNMSTYSLLIGNTNTFDIYSYMASGVPKTNGNDVFIIIYYWASGDIEFCASSSLVSSNHYQATYIAKHVNETMARIYATSQPGFTMSYFDNTKFLNTPFIQRIENYLPQQFTMEITRLFYFSIRVECILIFAYSTTYTSSTLSSDVLFSITLADSSLVKVYIGSTLYLDSSFSCGGSYYSSSETCCLQTQNFTLKSADMTGVTPYYLRIDYRHLAQSDPCIRVWRKTLNNTNMTIGVLDPNAYSLTELSESPFLFQPVINPNLINVTLTGKTIGSNTMQATVPNVIAVYPKDIYGNTISGLQFNLQFTATLIDGNQTISNVTSYNNITKRYEVTLTPTYATSNATLSMMHTSTNINNSPANITVIAGPYNFTTSYWQEWNNNGNTSCYITQVCNIRMTLKDSDGNLVTIPYIFSSSDMDSFIIGPYGTLNAVATTQYLQNIDNSNSSLGYYYFNYTLTLVGQYNVYLRLKGDLAPSYPMSIQVYTTSIYAPYSYLTVIPVPSQVVGVPFTVQILAKDSYNNTVTQYIGSTFISVLSLEGSSTTKYAELTCAYFGNGLYNLSTVAYTSGIYDFNVYLGSVATSSEELENTPTSFYIAPTYTDAAKSTVTGTGIKSSVVGRVENMFLQVCDIYGNDYNSATINGMSVYKVYAVANGSTSIQVNLTNSYPSQSYFQLSYQLISNYTTLLLHVLVANSSDGGVTFTYQDITGSPFTVKIGYLDTSLYQSYNDIILGGFGVSAYSTMETLPSPIAGSAFNITIDPKNQYDQDFVYFETSGKYFLTDFAYEEGSGSYPCNCVSTARSYCHFYSHSKSDCDYMVGSCVWRHGSGFTTYTTNLYSCYPCTCLGDEGTYSVDELSSDTNYYLQVSDLTKTGTYLVEVHVWEIGGLQTVIYQDPDFTHKVDSFKQYSLNMTMNTVTSSFFTNHTQGYSVTLQGKVRTDYNNLYNFTIDSNKKVLLYLNGVLMLNKSEAIKEARSFQIEMYANELLPLEIYLSSSAANSFQGYSELPPERDGELGYLLMYEESGNFDKELIKPKNMFTLVNIAGSGSSTIVVKATTGSLSSSYAYESTSLLSNVSSSSTVEYQAGQSFDIQIVVNDQYGNQRGTGYSDVVTAKLYLNGTLQSSSSSLSQSSLTGNYYYTFSPTSAPGTYTLYTYLNSVVMTAYFSFYLIPGNIDMSLSSATLIGFNQYTQQDCIFVNQPFYVVINMQDAYSNKIPYTQASAYLGFISSSLTNGELYYNNECSQYNSNYYEIICKFKPTTVGSGQSFELYNAQSLVSFSGFPLSLTILPYKQALLIETDSAQISKSFSVLSSTQDYIQLQFLAEDIYGNLISSESICSLFTHDRYLIYAQPLYFYNGVQLSNTLYTLTVSESFTPATNLKAISLTVSHSASPTFVYDSLYLNYTIADGLTLDDGLLMKYYSNNNFQDKPFFTQVILTSYMSNSNTSSQWYKMFKSFEQFSVKMTTLIQPQYTELYSFMTGFSSNFELWIDDILVIASGSTSGTINLVSGKWTKLKALYRNSYNTGSVASVPQYLLMWQSTSQTLSQISKNNGVAYDLDDTDGERLERGGYQGNVLIRDYYQAY